MYECFYSNINVLCIAHILIIFASIRTHKIAMARRTIMQVSIQKIHEYSNIYAHVSNPHLNIKHKMLMSEVMEIL
jgi:hypothetical protein